MGWFGSLDGSLSRTQVFLWQDDDVSFLHPSRSRHDSLLPQKHFDDKENLVIPMKPLRLETPESELAAIFTESDFKADYRILNGEVRKLGFNIPPLVNAYMNLSPTMKLFGTAINYGFGDVEETGILIAVDEILEEKRVRHINTFIQEHPEALKITSGANNVIYKEKEE